MLDLLLWHGLILGLVLIFAPLSRRVVDELFVLDEPRRVEIIIASTLPLGLLAITYTAWITMLFHLRLYTPFGVWGGLLLIGGVTWGLWGKETVSLLARQWRRLLLIGVIYAVIGGIWWVIRAAGNVHFIPIGEHVMNLSFAQMFPRYQQVPPPNPLFAGHVIDFYYYFFALLISTLAVLSHLPIPETYFLMGVTWPAWVAVQMYVLTRAFSSRRSTPWFALLFYMFLGNWGLFLHIAAEAGWIPASVLRYLSFRSSLQVDYHLHFPPHSELWWFWPTRLIPDASPGGYAITEFPFFSFIIGDLHPHVVVLPWTLLGLLVIAKTRLDTWRKVFIVAFIVGYVAVVNSWTFPVLLVLMGLFVLRTQGFRAAVSRGLVVAFLALLFFAPFYVRLHSPIVAYRVGLFPTPLVPWAFHWAPFLLPLALVLGLGFFGETRWGGGKGERAFFLLGGLLVIVGCWVHLCLLSLILLSIVWVVMPRSSGRGEDAPVVFLLGWMMLNALVDLFYMEDFWGGRYNTIFKVYFEAWTLLAVSMSLFLERLSKWGRTIAVMWSLSGLLYPVAVVLLLLGNMSDALQPVHLRWLSELVWDTARAKVSSELSTRADVHQVLEMDLQTPPAPVMYGLVEVAQRDPVMLLWYPDRIRDVGRNPMDRNVFFRSHNEAVRAAILKRYHVDAVILGRKEHWTYGFDVDFALSTLLTPAFGAEKTVAYRVYTPVVCLDLEAPVVFEGKRGKAVLERLRVTRGRDFSHRDVLSLFEIWEVSGVDPAILSAFVHFLDAQGSLVGQGDHPLGVWGTRWQDPASGRIAGVHWTSVRPTVEVNRISLGVWIPSSREHFLPRSSSPIARVRGNQVDLPLRACR